MNVSTHAGEGMRPMMVVASAVGVGVAMFVIKHGWRLAARRVVQGRDRFQLEELPFDTGVLGVRTARVKASTDPTVHEVQAVHKRAASQGFELVYWSRPAGNDTALLLSCYSGPHFVDTKVWYTLDITEKAITTLRAVAAAGMGMEAVQFYAQDEPPERVDEVLQLGFAAGVYSRFNCDPQLSTAQFRKMYGTWMRNCLGLGDKLLADVIFVVRRGDNGTILGVIAVKSPALHGIAGEVQVPLLAVDEKIRNGGIGSALIAAALQWLMDNGERVAKFSTQVHNPARRLYRRFGSRQLPGAVHDYHFWIALESRQSTS